MTLPNCGTVVTRIVHRVPILRTVHVRDCCAHDAGNHPYFYCAVVAMANRMLTTKTEDVMELDKLTVCAFGGALLIFCSH